MNNILRVKVILLGCVAFAMFACFSVFTKEASFCPFLSSQYCFWVVCELSAMFLYAILWMRLLTYVPLNRAYLYKSSTLLIVFTLMHTFYGETISVYKLVGFFFIILGLYVLSTEKL